MHYNGRYDQIKAGHCLRNLFQDGVGSQSSNTAKCHYCNEEFSCVQFLDTHKKEVHNKVEEFKCRMCNKKFSKQCLLNLHVKRNHSSNIHNCSECGKKSKLYINHLKHVQTHSSKKSWTKKWLSNLKKSQQYVRCKEEIQSIRNTLF